MVSAHRVQSPRVPVPTLPNPETGGRRPADEGAAARSGRRRPGTILVAGSDSDLVELLAFAVQQGGHTPVPAPDCDSARRLLAAGRPDAAVIDLSAPVGDGLRLLWELRRSDLPVLVVTNDRAVDAVVPRLCAEDCFVKPFSPRALLARLGVRVGQADPGSVRQSVDATAACD